MHSSAQLPDCLQLEESFQCFMPRSCVAAVRSPKTFCLDFGSRICHMLLLAHLGKYYSFSLRFSKTIKHLTAQAEFSCFLFPFFLIFHWLWSRFGQKSDYYNCRQILALITTCSYFSRPSCRYKREDFHEQDSKGIKKTNKTNRFSHYLLDIGVFLQAAFWKDVNHKNCQTDLFINGAL